MSSTGENEQGLRAIIDFIRLGSILLLATHFYTYCYVLFDYWGLAVPAITQFLIRIGQSPLLQTPAYIKAFALTLLVISIFGVKGKKDVKSSRAAISLLVIGGMALYWGGPVLFQSGMPPAAAGIMYMILTSAGFLMLLSGGVRISRLIKVSLDDDVFNELNETFPQEEQYRNNEHSINLPAKYNLKGKIRNSWINVIAPFRATMIIGSGGSGKSYFIIRHYITQMISKGFTMFLYDFKYDDLTKIAYNALLKYRSKYKKPPSFYTITFDDPSRSHRCNPLDPQDMGDITDATEASRTILLALNRDWSVLRTFAV